MPAEIGDCRGRYPARDALAAMPAKAPPRSNPANARSPASGGRAPKGLRDAFCTFTSAAHDARVTPADRQSIAVRHLRPQVACKLSSISECAGGTRIVSHSANDLSTLPVRAVGRRQRLDPLERFRAPERGGVRLAPRRELVNEPANRHELSFHRVD